MKKALSGPFPLLVTPWTEDAKLDIAVLVKEARYVSSFDVGGFIWPTAGEVLWHLSEEEYEAGLRALAAVGGESRLIATCPGKTSAEALGRAALVQRIADETGACMGLLARMPDDAADQAAIEAHYRALAGVVRMPVVIQTFNDGKSPQPDVEVLVRLTRDGDGNLTDDPMTDAEKREVEQRMRYCGLLPEEEK